MSLICSPTLLPSLSPSRNSSSATLNKRTMLRSSNSNRSSSNKPKPKPRFRSKLKLEDTSLLLFLLNNNIPCHRTLFLNWKLLQHPPCTNLDVTNIQVLLYLLLILSALLPTTTLLCLIFLLLLYLQQVLNTTVILNMLKLLLPSRFPFPHLLPLLVSVINTLLVASTLPLDTLVLPPYLIHHHHLPSCKSFGPTLTLPRLFIPIPTVLPALFP